MENPLRVLRARLGLSRAGLALRAGLTYHQICVAELGYDRRLSPSVLAALSRVTGVDGETLARDYAVWREKQMQKAAV